MRIQTPFVGSKLCFTCRAIKPHTEFHTAPRCWDGLTRSCKDCNVTKCQEWNRSWRARKVAPSVGDNTPSG